MGGGASKKRYKERRERGWSTVDRGERGRGDKMQE